MNDEEFEGEFAGSKILNEKVQELEVKFVTAILEQRAPGAKIVAFGWTLLCDTDEKSDALRSFSSMEVAPNMDYETAKRYLGQSILNIPKEET